MTTSLSPDIRILLLCLTVGWCGSGRTVTAADVAPAGRVVGIESARPVVFRLRTGTGLVTVRASDATVFQSVREAGIRPGVALRVEGRQRGDALDATQIELLKLTIGRVASIQEVFPLRLVLETADGRATVELKTATTITDGNRRIDPGRLRNGQWVAAFGTETSGRLKADAIDVLSERSGIISAIREVFPPQLVLNSANGSVEIRPDEGTAVQRGSKRFSISSLKTGQKIRAVGIEADDRLFAILIELQE